MKMLKKLMVSFVAFSLVFMLAQPVFSQETDVLGTKAEPVVDSYVIFYPVVAGKVDGDSLYTLKLIRDKLGELTTFGSVNKSEYTIGIATKRLLEAERLIKISRSSKIEKTLSKFNTKLAGSFDLAIASKDSEFFPELLQQIHQNCDKYLSILTQMLKSSPELSKDAIQEAIQRTAEIQTNATSEIEKY